MKNNNLFKIASVSVVAVALFTAPVAEASFFDVEQIQRQIKL